MSTEEFMRIAEDVRIALLRVEDAVADAGAVNPDNIEGDREAVLLVRSELARLSAQMCTKQVTDATVDAAHDAFFADYKRHPSGLWKDFLRTALITVWPVPPNEH